MRIALFGGSGRIGSLVLERALAAGHRVQALARKATRLPVRVGLTVAQGPLDDGEAVSATLRNADAAICCLSAGNGTLGLFDGAVLPLMLESGPRRIVSMVGASVRMPGDPSTLALRLMSLAMRLVPGHLLADAEAHAVHLRESGLEWTLVRSANHAGRPATGRILARPGYAMRLDASIARGDLAAFILECAVDDRFVGEAPMVENG